MPAQDPDKRAASAAKRQAALAEKKAAEELEQEQRHAWLNSQLETVAEIVRILTGRLNSARDIRRRSRDFSNHVDGFYEEIDKLAKGKALLEVTTLVVGEVNQIIRDAKGLVSGDQYLDRVKEFVPAGNNPVYPDVVIALRTVRQSLERSVARLEPSETQLFGQLSTARTIAAALRVYLTDGQLPTLGQVRQELRDTGGTDKAWFLKHSYGDDSSEREFDIERLERIPSLSDFFGTAIDPPVRDEH